MVFVFSFRKGYDIVTSTGNCEKTGTLFQDVTTVGRTGQFRQSSSLLLFRIGSYVSSRFYISTVMWWNTFRVPSTLWRYSTVFHDFNVRDALTIPTMLFKLNYRNAFWKPKVCMCDKPGCSKFLSHSDLRMLNVHTNRISKRIIFKESHKVMVKCLRYRHRVIILFQIVTMLLNCFNVKKFNDYVYKLLWFFFGKIKIFIEGRRLWE